MYVCALTVERALALHVCHLLHERIGVEGQAAAHPVQHHRVLHGLRLQTQLLQGGGQTLLDISWYIITRH